MFVFSVSFMYAGNTEVEAVLAKEEVGTEGQVEREEASEEDALYCKVTRKNGDVVECWLCNCRGLAEQLAMVD